MAEGMDEAALGHVTCIACGRVSFTVSRETAEGWARDARRDFLMRRPAQAGVAPTYRPGDLSCLACRGTRFRAAREGDCPPGCTINPVVIGPGEGTLDAMTGGAGSRAAPYGAGDAAGSGAFAAS